MCPIRGESPFKYNEMFIRMLAAHSDQNISYEISMDGYRARKNQQNKKM